MAEGDGSGVRLYRRIFLHASALFTPLQFCCLYLLIRISRDDAVAIDED